MTAAWPTGLREVRLRRPGGPELVLRIGPPPAAPSGPPVLLLPGLGDPASSYAPVLPTLIARHHVHLLDYRGHAPSGPDEAGRYAVHDHLDDVLAMLDLMPAEPVLICGNSLGGVLALGAAARQPGRVAGIVLEDAPVFLIEGDAWRGSPIRSGFARIAAMLRQHARGETSEAAYLVQYERRPWAFGGSAGHPGRVRHLDAILRLLDESWPELAAEERQRLQRGHGQF